VPPGGFLARHGGDEFVLMLEGQRGQVEAGAAAEHLLGALEEPFPLAGGEIFVEACAGIGVFPDHGDDAATLLRHADTALRRAKREGGRRVCVYDDEMGRQIKRRLELVTGLRHALQRDEFELHYQPQYDIQRRNFAGMEVLLRWRRPGGGLVSPGEFIPIAEDSGLITPIGARILEQAARQCREWLDAGFDPVRVSVNVSGRQFADQDVAELVLDALRTHGLPAGCLGIEIVESTLVEQPDAVEDTLHLLKQAGVHVSLDDFGTGFSSFSYLSRFPLDVLKIDASFVARIGQSYKDNRIIVSMIELARTLNMRVVAEGVETERQVNFLLAHGCDSIQGYVYARPMPAGDLVRFVGAANALDESEFSGLAG